MSMFFYVLGLQNLLYLKNELMKWADFLHADTNLGKLKVTLIILGWACSKTGRGIVDHETLKSRLSQMICWIEQIDWMIFACL